MKVSLKCRGIQGYSGMQTMARNLFPNLLNGVANAAVGHLDVQHRANSGGNVDHAGGGAGAALAHIPTQEHQRDV